MQAYPVFDHRGAFNVDNVAVGQDVVWPAGFCHGVVAVADALGVEGLINMFEESDAHDAVVGVTVLYYRGDAEGGGLGEGAVYAVGIEEFVYAGIDQYNDTTEILGKTYKGESSLGRRAPPLISRRVRELG
jgi:hypothetical protein